MRLHANFPFVISHHPAKFGGHKPCRRGDILFFICNMTSCDNIIRSLVTLLVGSHCTPLSCQVWWSQVLWKRRYFNFSLLCDLTWLYCQTVTWHYRWVSLITSDYPVKFGDQRPCGRGDIKLSFCHVTSLDWCCERVIWHHGFFFLF